MKNLNKMKNMKSILKADIQAFAIIILIALTTLSSCKKDDEVVIQGENNPSSIIDDITEDITIDGEVLFIGAIHIKNGAILTVNPGTRMVFDPDALSYLLVEQGAKIMAEGTHTNPIIMTGGLEEPGSWGGLHICGKAPINSGETGLSEIGDAVYGGNIPNDNSGSLQYVRVEYSGTNLDADHQGNGISFYGVGNETLVDYVQVYQGFDDGIEFFGGTVNIKHIIVNEAEDDSFDWVEGWSGKAQFLIAVQGEAGDRGFEGDNLKADNAASPKSMPHMSNITLIGGGDADNYGIKLRRGTAGIFKNIIIAGDFDKGSIHIENSETLRNLVNGSLLIDYAYINNVVFDVAISYSEDESDPVNIDDFRIEDSPHVFLQNLSHGITESTVYSGGFDMSTEDSFFNSTDYI
ncbi:MAG: hypothetical protein GQ527_07705, partial [Bacteroidales bacterium]|nr:hypothetical protein [Bacteroidales bacterium]